MSAPTRQRKGRVPEGNPALISPPSDATHSTADDSDFDFDQRVAAQVDCSIWRAIYNGEFRLATKCLRCGRWLTDGRSKRRQHGAICAAKAGVA